MNSRSDYIAVFDSGVGGISVLGQLLQQMPQERYLYFGDSANAPYGTRSCDQVRQLTLAAVEQLMQRGVKALVIACNTATAAAIELLRSRYPDTVIIGIEPAIKLAAEHFPGGRIGVLATPVTLAGEKYQRLARRFAADCRLIALPAPGLAELVEEGKANSPAAAALLDSLLSPYRGQLDALVLGCTHYPFAAQTISAVAGTRLPLYDGGAGTARETYRRLAAAGLLYDGPGEIRMENSLPDRDILELSMRLLAQQKEAFRG